MTTEIQHSERKHTEISPSKISRISKCPASVALCRAVKKRVSELLNYTSNEAATRGTRLHEVQEEMWLMGRGNTKLLDSLSEEEKLIALDCYEAVATYAKEEYGEDGNIIPELTIVRRLEDIDIAGTLDAPIVSEDKLSATIIDYKFGAKEVEAKDNEQLLCQVWLLTSLYPKLQKVTLCIYQDGELDLWSAIDLKANPTALIQIENWMRGIVLDTKRKTEPVAGEHCFFCPAKVICKAYFMQFAAQLPDAVISLAPLKPLGELPAPETLSDNDLAQALKYKLKAEAWFDAVKSYLETKVIRDNEKIPGVKVVAKASRRIWSDENAAINALLYHGFEPYKKELKSPAQMGKEIKLEEYPVIHDLVERVPGGFTVAHESDKRKEVQLTNLTALEDNAE